MNKEIYLINGEKTESYEAFKARIMKAMDELVKEIQPVTLKFTITDKPVPRLAIIPFRKSKMAAISVQKKEDKTIDQLTSMKGFYGAYQVKEALPVSYNKNWEDKNATPGVCLLTLFSRKKGIDFDTFIDRWHNSHTPLSLRIHPLWNYVRNVVESPLTDQSKNFEGIVEENFRTEADLLNPFRFFGNPLIILYRMLQVLTDTRSFIDYPTMETYLTTEYHIIS
jgi:hypothetical protein